MYGTAPDPCPNCGYQHGAQTAFYAPTTVLVLRGDVFHSNNLLSSDVRAFIRDAETALQARRRRAREASVAAIREARLRAPGRLEERLYDRPRRKGRACGSRHRVMLT
jgi:hypothetical protein